MRSQHADEFNHDEDAAGYDADVLNEDDPIRTGYGELLPWLAEQVNLRGGERVLELGSGTGNLTRMLLDAWATSASQDPGSVVAVDVSGEMTRLAQEKLGPEAPVEFVQADFLEAIEGLDQKFDRVVSSYSLHHLTTEEKAVLAVELGRVLEVGGRFVVGDLMFESVRERELARERYLERGLPVVAEAIEEEFFWLLDLDRPALEAAGFTVSTRRFSDLSWGLVAERRPEGLAT